MTEILVSYHFPTTCPSEKEGKKWKRAAIKIGRVRQDGRIENTPYRFRRRTVRGGIAYTRNQELIDLPNGDKMNPATGSRFKKCKSGKGYWSRRDKTFVPEPYLVRKRRVQK